MKNRLILLKFIVLGLLVLSSGIAAETSKPLVKEIVIHENDSIFRFTYFYDEYANKVLETKYFYFDNISVPIEQQEWIYDAENCVQQQKRKWDSGNWKTSYLINTVYTGDLKTKVVYSSVNKNIEKVEKTITYLYTSGKLKSVKSYRGKSENNDLSGEEQFTYNDKGQVLRQEMTYYSDVKKQMFSSSQTYNKLGKTDSLIVSDNSGSSLLNLYLTVYQYKDSLLTTQIQKVWNPNSRRWVNAARSEFTYQGDSLLKSEIYSQHSGMFWTPHTKYEYIYDNQGFLSRKLMYQPIYKEWRRIYTIEYGNIEYNKPNFMESKYNFWGGVTGDYVSNFIPFYFNDEMSLLKASKVEVKYIIDPTLISSSSLIDDFLRVYPNPSEGVFYISTQNHIITHWEVFSLSGTCIKTGFNNFRSGVVDLTGTPPGMYLVKAYTVDNKLLIQKISVK